MRERLQKFMQGRYGVDSLSRFMMMSSLVLVILSMLFARFPFVSILLDTVGVVGLFFAYFRALSRDIPTRASENRKYLNITSGLRRRINKEKYMMNERKLNHIYSCPGCAQKIRIPKGKGRIEIECPKCHTKFVKKS